MFNISNNYGNLNLEEKGRFLMNELNITELVHENIQLINSLGLINTIFIDESGYFITSDNKVTDGTMSNVHPQLYKIINFSKIKNGTIIQRRIILIISIGLNLINVFDNLVKSFIKNSNNVDNSIKKAIQAVKINFKSILKSRNLNLPTIQEKFNIRSIILDKKDIDKFILKLNYKSIL